MSWNYRVIKKVYRDEEDFEYTIHEVYYDKNGEVESYTEHDIAPSGETFEELVHDLAHMKEAFSRPVLIEVEGKLIEEDNGRERSS